MKGLGLQRYQSPRLRLNMCSLWKILVGLLKIENWKLGGGGKAIRILSSLEDGLDCEFAR